MIKAANKNEHTFRVSVGHNRWCSHLNWGDGLNYFDSGCCDGVRSYDNNINNDVWQIYVF